MAKHLASVTVALHVKNVYIGVYVPHMQAYSLYKQAHRKKYNRIKSGEQAGHAAVPLLHIHLPR